MTGPTGLLNFFVLEASEYVEQLDALLNTAGSTGPDAESFTRSARALRGSATMAKLSGISALAAGTERIGRALRERALPWTPSLRQALVATVDDLRILVRNARGWSDDDERRAQTRTAELLGFVPPAARATSPTPISTSTGALFVVSGATDVAAAFTAAVSRPANPDLLSEALRRLRGLRGVASIKDYPPLPDLLEALEQAARPAGVEARKPESEELAVLSAGARWLRRAAEDIRAGRRPDTASEESGQFQDALARASSARSDRDRVVPVRELFHDDEGPHVVESAAAPATTALDRFRLESAGAAEHARRLIADARSTARGDRQGAADATSVSGAVDTLVSLVRSYDHGTLADLLARVASGVASLDPVALGAADAAAAVFIGRPRPVEEMEERLGDLLGGRVVGTVVNVGYAPVERPRVTPAGLHALGVESAASDLRRPAAPATLAPDAPTPAVAGRAVPADLTRPTVAQPVVADPQERAAASAAPAAPPVEREREVRREEAADRGFPVHAPAVPPPSGRDLHALLEDGIAGIARLQDEPSDGLQSRPTPMPDDVVPVEALMYRGRAALGRAIELRDEIRAGSRPPSPDQLEELFELLDLAAAP